jgi:hypothetical protein
MRKRALGEQPRHDKPSYPTYEQFDASRRAMLKQLGAIGAAIFGAAALAGCTERNVSAVPDGPQHTGGVARPLDARIDTSPPDAGQPKPEGNIMGGVAQPPDSRVDRRPIRPDAEIMAGGKPGPDARIEERD